jgi:glycosyltransferase involved in cell wall biosynthesis
MSVQLQLGHTESIAARVKSPAGSCVLVLVGHYLPGYKAGGPIRSIESLVGALGGDFHFKIVTLDRDLGDKSAFPGIVANRWVRVGHADVMYLRPGLLGFFGMYALLRSVDRKTILYLNSFFARRFSMLAVLMRWLKLCRAKCLVLAPRGEFSQGALQFKHTRKRVYLGISQWLGLYQGLIWHASSDFEETDIRRQFPLLKRVAVTGVIPSLEAGDGKRPTSHVVIASDIPSSAPPVRRERRTKMPCELRAVFVARCSRMKNLAGALRMLGGVSGDISFDIYGPAEDADYWEECQGLIAALPPNIHVQYCGQVEHSEINQVFASHDLLLFPTLGENYGHVICEALVSGCPVLISDQTPWRGLEALEAGWDLPLSDPERFREVLQRCVDMGPEEHTAMCARAAAAGASRASDTAVIEDNRALFRLALGAPISK